MFFSRKKNEGMTVIPPDLGFSHLSYRYVNPLYEWFKTIYVPERSYRMVSKNDEYCVLDDIVYRRSDHALMLVLPCKRKRFVVPDHIVEIVSGAFDYCQIEEVEIPQTVKGHLPTIGCSPKSIIVRGNISSLYFDQPKKPLSLQTLILPNNKMRIGEGSLAGCSDLTKLVLPSFLDLTVIGTNEILTMPQYGKPTPFSGCTKLNKLTAGNIEETWDPVTSTLTIAGSGACHGSVFLSHFFVSPKKIIIGDQITQVAFGPGSLDHRSTRAARCGQHDVLTEVVFGSSVRKIAYGAFRECKELSHIHLPQSLEEIGPCAFMDCPKLIIPALSNVKIGEKAFLGCKNTPFPLKDYENTFFSGQTRVFVEPSCSDFHSDYLRAMSLLEKFCRTVVFDGRFIHSENAVGCWKSYSGRTYHDGTEYDVSRSIFVGRIPEETYYRSRVKQIPHPNIADPALYGSMYTFICENSFDAFIQEVSQNDDSARILLYAKDLLGISGYFKIKAEYEDTR